MATTKHTCRMLGIFAVLFLNFSPLVPSAFSATEAEKQCDLSKLDNAPTEDQIEVLRKLRREVEGLMTPYTDPFSHAPETSIPVFKRIWEEMFEAFPLLDKVSDHVTARSRWETTAEEGTKIIHDTIEAVEFLKGQAQPDYAAIGGAVEALRLLEYGEQAGRPVRQPAKKEPEKKKEEEKKKEKREKKPKQPPPPPRSEDLPDKYKVGQEKDGNEEGDGQERISIAHVDAPNLRLWREIRYQGSAGTELEWFGTDINEPIPEYQDPVATHVLKMNTSIKKQGRLYLPTSLLPKVMKIKGLEIYRDGSRNWHYRTTLDEISVPLFRQAGTKRPLSDAELIIYRMPNNVALTDFPVALQLLVNQLKEEKQKGTLPGFEGDLLIAGTLSKFIARTYKYTKTGDPDKLTTTLFHEGAFKCDRAADALVSILRNEFKIACAPVGGWRGVGNEKMPGTTHLILPAEKHAWVEVPDADGNWRVFDPTPTTPLNKEDQDNADDEFRQLPDSQGGEEGSHDEDKIGEKISGGKAVQEGDLKKAIEIQKALQEEHRKKLTNAQKEKAAAKAKHDEEYEQGPKGKTPGGDGGSEGAHHAEKEGEDAGKTAPSDDPSKEIDETEPFRKAFEESAKRVFHDNSLVQSLLRQLAAWSLDFKISNNEKVNRIERMRGAVGGDRNTLTPWFHYLGEFSKLLSGGKFIFAKGKGSFEERLADLAGRERPMNEIAEELVEIRKQMAYSAPWMPDRARPHIEQFLQSFVRASRTLNTYKHKDARRIRIAEELYNNLPGGITRRIIRQDYGIEDGIGDNVNTMRLSDAISAKKMQKERLLSILGPFTRWITDPIYKPSKIRALTLLRNLKRTDDPFNYLPTSDPRDLQKKKHLLLLNPEQTPEEALASGNALVKAQRRIIELPGGTSGKDAEDIIILGIDVSGSMSGAPADFQAHYVGALADWALSDLNAAGQPKHKVIVVPYGTNVHREIQIFSGKEAEDSVRAIIAENSKFGNKGEGTDIEAFLTWSAQRIKRAVDEGDKLVSRAIVVCAGDGQGSINADNVRSEFRKINQKTNTLLGFVAINGVNDTFKELAENPRLGVDKSLYYQWDSDQMAKVLEQSKEAPEPENDFWTNYKGPFPGDLRNALRDLSASYGKLLRSIDIRGNDATVIPAVGRDVSLRGAYLRQFKRSSTNDREGKDQMLKNFRLFLDPFGHLLPSSARTEIMETILKDFKVHMGASINELTLSEIENIEYILKWPDTGIAGEKADR